MFYVQAVGLALLGLAAGLVAPIPLVIALSVMGAIGLIWIAILKNRGLGSGAVEAGMFITLCIFFVPMAVGLLITRVFPLIWFFLDLAVFKQF